jgi:methyl-accepting chemotaxis protein
MRKTKRSSPEETNQDETLQEVKESMSQFKKLAEMILTETRDTKVCTQTLETNISVLKNTMMTFNQDLQSLNKEVKDIKEVALTATIPTSPPNGTLSSEDQVK